MICDTEGFACQILQRVDVKHQVMLGKFPIQTYSKHYLEANTTMGQSFDPKIRQAYSIVYNRCSKV